MQKKKKDIDDIRWCQIGYLQTWDKMSVGYSTKTRLGGPEVCSDPLSVA